jgi:hypothetical protein
MKLVEHLLQPVRAMRLRYLPLLMVYFSYGALGVIDISRDLWVKESLTLSPAELAGIGVWLGFPWTIKMVFGELVDTVTFFGSRRRSYVLLGAACTASGLLILAGAAAHMFDVLPVNKLLVMGMMLIVIGTVLQDVVADAMSTEVVARLDASGNLRPEPDVSAELGIVQVLGRLALSVGILAVAGLSGWLAGHLERATVFLIALVVPLISIVGVLLIRLEPATSRPLNWKFLAAGLLFGTAILVLSIANYAFSQEISFLVSIGVICAMLFSVTRALPSPQRRALFYAAITIFAFRATPTIGDGYFWWSFDILNFDAPFYGVLRQTSAIIGLVAMWLLARELTEYAIQRILFALIVIGFFLSLPTIGLFYGLSGWTESNFGLGARSIAIIDAAAASPFAQLSMVPLLALIARHAPPAFRATWFALMASLMNLALVMGQLQTKYLNLIFPVQRGNYDALGELMITVAIIGFLIPMSAVLIAGRKIQ